MWFATKKTLILKRSITYHTKRLKLKINKARQINLRVLNLSKDMSRNGIQNSNEMIVLGKHTEISKSNDQLRPLIYNGDKSKKLPSLSIHYSAERAEHEYRLPHKKSIVLKNLKNVQNSKLNSGSSILIQANRKSSLPNNSFLPVDSKLKYGFKIN